MENSGKEGVRQSRERNGKAPERIALFLAGALAGAGATQVAEQYKYNEPVVTGIQNPPPEQFSVSDSYDTYETVEYGEGSSFEFPASREAVEAVIGLDKTVGQQLKATAEQRAQIREMIGEYVKTHPPVEGKTEEQKKPDGSVTVVSGPSYSPYYELWNASMKLGISSALKGALEEELAQHIPSGSE